jgi:predicted aspartyl protease
LQKNAEEKLNMQKRSKRLAAPLAQRKKMLHLLLVLTVFYAGLFSPAFLCSDTVPDAGQIRPSLAAAQEAFRQGRFTEADSAFLEVLRSAPREPEALLGLGYLRLLQNRLDEAEKILCQVLKQNPARKDANEYLAEAYCRRDRYDLAAPLLRAAGREPQAMRLEAFKGMEPYSFDAAPESSEVPFEITDPLPVVKLKVNGREAEFLIDTGGASLILDPEFAGEVGATIHAEVEGVFAGGVKRALGIGKIDRVEIGGYKLRHVSVGTLPMGPIAAMFARPLKGIVGTCFLYHFLFTLDYPGGKLVLYRRSEANSEALAARNRDAQGHELPLWLAGDHFIATRGRVNDSPEVMCFLDTGMAGGGIGLSEAMAKAAGVELPTESQAGLGGGGMVRARPIMAREVRLGAVLEKNVPGNVGSGPLKSEFRDRLGFSMPAIVSHAFFRSYRTTFDLLNMRLLLARGSEGKE